MMGCNLFIPTAASENAINAFWLIILGVWTDGLGVPCSTCPIWHMGFSITGICVEVVLVVFLSDSCFSLIFSRGLYFLVLFFFHFWSLFFSHSFGHPLKLVLGEKFLPPYVFSMVVAFRVVIIPGVLLRVNLECTRGAVRMLDFVVSGDEVCILCSCFVSNFSLAVSNIFVSCSKACPCRPVFILRSFNILCIALVRYPAMGTALSIGVSFGAFT